MPPSASTVAGCALALATAMFGRPGGLARSLLKPIKRPPLPALGHSRHREQPLDFISVTGVDAKHVSDGETTSRPLEHPDLITCSYTALDDQSQVRARSQRLGKPARKQLVAHPDSKPPARDSWLGNLKHRGADLPALADKSVVHLHPFGGEILAELAVPKRS